MRGSKMNNFGNLSSRLKNTTITPIIQHQAPQPQFQQNHVSPSKLNASGIVPQAMKLVQNGLKIYPMLGSSTTIAPIPNQGQGGHTNHPGINGIGTSIPYPHPTILPHQLRKPSILSPSTNAQRGPANPPFRGQGSNRYHPQNTQRFTRSPGGIPTHRSSNSGIQLQNIAHYLSSQSVISSSPKSKLVGSSSSPSKVPSSGGAARVSPTKGYAHTVGNGSGGSKVLATAPVVVKTEEPCHVPFIQPSPSPFRKGDDILLTTDDGTYMFGTVGMVYGENLQILFGDGTQQLASFDRVKLLSCSVEDDDEPEPSGPGPAPVSTSGQVQIAPKIEPHYNEESSGSNRKGKGLVKVHTPLTSPTERQSSSGTNLPTVEITCVSCGVVKRVAGKKALIYAPHTKTPFHCRRCLNKSRCSKNIALPIMSVRTGKSSTSPSSPSKGVSQRQSEAAAHICFNCEKPTKFNDRLHCNLCEKACHLSCLSHSPTPLVGDCFWDVICSSCGTQNVHSQGSGGSKVFSCRRSISSWSDVAHLVLSCLSCQPEQQGERYFDLDNDIIPFIDANMDRLHLPRPYKNVQPESRKKCLTTALTNATLRFVNGGEVSRKDTLWAVRDTSSHNGYPFRVVQSPVKNHSSPSNNASPRPFRAVRESPGKGGGMSEGRSQGTSPGGGGSPHFTRSSPGKAELLTPTKGRTPEMGKGTPTPPKGKGITGQAMAQSQRLIQKAKKQAQQASLESTKRKASDSPSPDAKRLKVSPQSRSPVASQSSGSPPLRLQQDKMQEWLQSLNAAVRNPSTPDQQSQSPMSGRAVKSAGLTPPGSNQYQTPDKERPALRLRKPKSLNLNGVEPTKRKDQAASSPVGNKVKGRPPKLLQAKISKAASQKFAHIPLQNGAPADEDLSAGQGEFSLLSSTLEDVANFGKGISIQCLPATPENPEKLKQKVAEAYATEAIPPAYLEVSDVNVGATAKKQKKSKRDLGDVSSYEITGRKIDKDGLVSFQVEWKDGANNSFSSEANTSLSTLDWDDLDDPAKVFAMLDQMDESENPPTEPTSAKPSPTKIDIRIPNGLNNNFLHKKPISADSNDATEMNGEVEKAVHEQDKDKDKISSARKENEAEAEVTSTTPTNDKTEENGTVIKHEEVTILRLKKKPVPDNILIDLTDD